MRVLIINSVINIGSTGRICLGIAKSFLDAGNEVAFAYGRGKVDKDALPSGLQTFRITNPLGLYLSALSTRLTDHHGFSNAIATKKFLRWVDKFNPDLIWMHNLHGYYIHVGILFAYLKKHPDIKKQWTLHDCWAFTGHCAYFTAAGCEKWKSACEGCPNRRKYPESWIADRSNENHREKRDLFKGVHNLEIICPSSWLASLVRQSFLSEYPVKVIYNRIPNLEPTMSPAVLRKRLGFEGKCVVMGAANLWEDRKGLSDFLALANSLGSNFVILLVGKIKITQLQALLKGGWQRAVNKKMGYWIYSCSKTVSVRSLEPPPAFIAPTDPGKVIIPDVNEAFRTLTGESMRDGGMRPSPVAKILVIPRPLDKQSLINLYSLADVFFNPTKEENYPTVNLEALSCGAYLLTYDIGGCKETLENWVRGEVYEK